MRKCHLPYNARRSTPKDAGHLQNHVFAPEPQREHPQRYGSFAKPCFSQEPKKEHTQTNISPKSTKRGPKSNPNRSQIGSEPILKMHLKKAILFFDVKNNVFEEKRSKKIRSNKHRCSIFAAIYSTLGHLYSKAFKAA